MNVFQHVTKIGPGSPIPVVRSARAQGFQKATIRYHTNRSGQGWARLGHNVVTVLAIHNGVWRLTTVPLSEVRLIEWSLTSADGQ